MTPIFACLVPAPLLLPFYSAQDATPADAAAGPPTVPAIVSSSVTAARQTVLFTDISTSTTSDVPGIPGAKFISFDRPSISPDGTHYVITADTDLATTEDDVLLVDGAVALREGDSPSFLDAGDTLNFFPVRVDINNAGQFVFGNTTEDDASENNYIVRGDGGGAFTVIAREGTQVVGAPAGFLAGTQTGGTILGTGEVGYEADNVTGTVSGGPADNNLLMFRDAILAQNGITIPAGQFGGGMETWDIFDFEDFHASDDGMHYIVQGDLTGDTVQDDVAVVDGTVVVQEGFPLPGGPADLVDGSGIFSIFMSHSGDWMADGDFDLTNQDWAVYNGNVVALEGEPLHPGTTEAWGAGNFFVSSCNGVGDYLIGGTTDAADTDFNAAVVLNGERVVVREGDPVDVDGNGLFDDNVFLRLLGSDDFLLTDDLQLYFVSSVREGGSTANFGDVFIRIDLSEGVGSAICAAAQLNSTGSPSAIFGEGSSNVSDNDLTLNVDSLPSGVMGYFVTSNELNLVMNPGGSAGDLCIASFMMGRYSSSVQVSDASGTISQSIDLTSVPSATGPVAVTAGETRYWQFWHRDTDMSGAATSNFSSALGVTFE